MTRRERLRDELLNAPNLITLARIALIPVFLYLLYYENRRNCFLAALIYAVCALTDWFDGWLARVSDKVTTLGKFLDPLSDKVIVLSALVMLVRLGRVAVWVVVAYCRRNPVESRLAKAKVKGDEAGVPLQLSRARSILDRAQLFLAVPGSCDSAAPSRRT